MTSTILHREVKLHVIGLSNVIDLWLSALAAGRAA
jgi:hypothetical protein